MWYNKNNAVKMNMRILRKNSIIDKKLGKY